MKNTNSSRRVLAFLTRLTIMLSFSTSTLAIDDVAREYWNGLDGVEVVSFQFLDLNMHASGSQQFAPGQYIYPNSDIEASIFILNWSHHFTLLKRPSSFSVFLAGGDISVDVTTSAVPPQFLPPGVVPGSSFTQSASGYADPAMQLTVNLLGAPQLKSGVDMLNYEPTWTLDAAAMLAFPIGKYDDDQLVNIGQNRWYGRLGLPFTYHFGAFTPGYRTSLEIIPSVWLFAENDDFLGQQLENDPLWQIEGHLTRDFTPNFFGSLDLLYRGGFQSEINGVEVGDVLNVGDVGFTLHYQVTDNMAIRGGYSTNVFGDDELDNSLFRIQFVFGWHPSMENMKKLEGGH